MVNVVLKAALTGAVVVAISEVAKRSTLVAAILASLPLTSILAMVWIYLDTRNEKNVATLSMGIFWMVLPSLVFFITLPALMRSGIRFPIALPISAGLMAGVYFVYVHLLRRVGISI